MAEGRTEGRAPGRSWRRTERGFQKKQGQEGKGRGAPQQQEKGPVGTHYGGRPTGSGSWRPLLNLTRALLKDAAGRGPSAVGLQVSLEDLPGGPVPKTLHFQLRGRSCDPWSGSKGPTS